MRLDKFLKVARLAKRRSEAKDAIDAGRIESRGKPLRASHAVKPGDELTIHYATRTLRVRVEAVPERSLPKGDAGSLYTILEDTAR
ncbi:MAG TPA: RNA-binding S4 domain-containing protein [Candidatus Acidoferrales bacterium]|nr:RNA-binding S4 domain-containing protein [Candidatus Acidoferrales bacterium]